MKTHKDLDVWKMGITLVKEIYAATSAFPKEEIYGLTAQIRRAAVSIPVNIAEGAARNSDKERIQFLYISLGSASELETLLVISQDLNFSVPATLLRELELIRKKLVNLIKYFKTK